MAAASTLVPRRGTPRDTAQLSVLTASLDPDEGARSAPVPTQVAWLRRARARGISTFSLGSAAREATAHRVVREAFPEPDPDLTFLLRLPAPEEPDRPRGPPSGAGNASDPWAEFAGRLARWHERGQVIALVERGSNGSIDPTVRETLVRFESDGLLADWATEASAQREDGPRRTIEFGSLSLLRPGLARDEPGTPPALIALDPFAGGRLDGSLLAGSTLDRPRPGLPPTVRELEGEFAPVLRLGFLTDGRSRTLLQAAVQFVVTPPRVLTTVVGLDAPDRLETVIAALRSPPLDASELARVIAGTAPESTGRPGDAGA